MVDDFAAFGRKCGAIADALDTGETMRGVAVKLKREAMTVLEADVGSDDAMSNWRRTKAVRIRVRYTEAGTQITMVGLPAGPWQVLEQGRRPGVSRRGRHYSSSRPKGTWSKAVDRMQDRVTPLVEANTARLLARIIGG